MKKVAIVTGGTRGIGRSISIELYEEGWKVISFYQKNKTHALDLKDSIPEIEIIQCDISDEISVNAAVKEIYNTYGRIDCLVNNAGVTQDGYFLMMSRQKWQDVININLLGTVNVSKSVLRFMKLKKEGGKVINISSTSGVAGQIGQANYAATKGALISLTKSLAKEVAGEGITVNCVSPGFIETEMTKNLKEKDKIIENFIPLKRFGKPNEVAALVSFLASDKANYITGKNFVIDGGMIND